MRVGIVCPYDLGAPGGVQQVCLDLAERLRDEGDQAFVVGPGKATFDGGPGFDATTIPVGRPMAIRANQSVVPLSLAPGSWRKVRKALESADVVHIHEPLVPLVGWAALSVSSPRVVTFHADAPGWVGRVYRHAPWVGRKLTKSHLTAVSEAALRSIPQHWGAPRVIPNAVDVASFDVPVGRVPHRVAFLGRDEPRKGLDILLEAWPRILENDPKAELVVMGADRETSQRGVKYLGRVTGGEKHRMLASTVVFVAPNTGGESFGIVLAEAMAAGCAVVASDLEAFRSVLRSDGLLVPVGDVAALAGAVSTVLTDSAQAQRLSLAGREAVKRFDWSVVIEEYRDAYAVAMSDR